MRIVTMRLLKIVGLAALLAVAWFSGTGTGKLAGADQPTPASGYLAEFLPDIGPTGPGPTDPNGPAH
jgi:hypothetical protein